MDDIESARADLVRRGAGVSEFFHNAVASSTVQALRSVCRARNLSGGRTDHTPLSRTRMATASSCRRSPSGFLAVEEAGHVRVGGRLEAALRCAAVAHGRFGREAGHEDPNLPTWYADHMWRARTDSTRCAPVARTWPRVVDGREQSTPPDTLSPSPLDPVGDPRSAIATERNANV